MPTISVYTSIPNLKTCATRTLPYRSECQRDADLLLNVVQARTEGFLDLCSERLWGQGRVGADGAREPAGG